MTAGLESLTPAVIVWVLLVVALAAYVFGLLGAGLPLIATPLLALVVPMHDAVVMLVLPTLAAIVLSIRSAPDFLGTLRRFWFMPVLATAGAVIGAQLFVRVPQFPYALVLAAAMLAWLWLDWHGRSESVRVQRRPMLYGVLFGFVAGVSETTANVAAPPLVAYYAGLGFAPGAMIQGLNLCFLPGKTAQFITLATLGGVTAAQWLSTLPLVLVTLIAQHRGIAARQRIDARTYRRWLRVALLAMAVLIVAQYAYGVARG